MQSTNYLGWTIFITFLVVLLYFFYRWRVKTLQRELPGVPFEEKSSSPFKFFNFFSKSPKMEKKLKFLRWRRKHKIKEKEHQDLSRKFGTAPAKVKHSHFSKLKRIVRHHEYKDNFYDLDTLHQAMKEKEARLAQKKATNEAILKLKKIAKKK